MNQTEQKREYLSMLEFMNKLQNQNHKCLLKYQNNFECFSPYNMTVKFIDTGTKSIDIDIDKNSLIRYVYNTIPLLYIHGTSGYYNMITNKLQYSTYAISYLTAPKFHILD